MYPLPRFPRWYLLFCKTIGQHFKQNVDIDTDFLSVYLYSSVLYRKATNLGAKRRENQTDALHRGTRLTFEGPSLLACRPPRGALVLTLPVESLPHLQSVDEVAPIAQGGPCDQGSNQPVRWFSSHSRWLREGIGPNRTNEMQWGFYRGRLRKRLLLLTCEFGTWKFKACSSCRHFRCSPGMKTM